MNMRSAMRSVRIHHANEAFKKAVENIVNALIEFPNQPIRASTKVAKWILLDHPTLISRGESYSTLVKSVGAGVQELYLIKLNKKGE